MICLLGLVFPGALGKTAQSALYGGRWSLATMAAPTPCRPTGAATGKTSLGGLVEDVHRRHGSLLLEAIEILTPAYRHRGLPDVRRRAPQGTHGEDGMAHS